MNTNIQNQKPIAINCFVMLLTMFLVFSAGSSCLGNQAAGRIYVDRSNATPGDGSSWGSAYNDLHQAIVFAGFGDTLWVAVGTYIPSVSNIFTGMRYHTFFIDKNLHIFGGFNGTETAFSQRNPVTNTTTLSGDTGIPGDDSDNAYHVIWINGPNNISTLDGFTITNGNAEGNAEPYYQGGAIYSGNYTSPLISNCTFENNAAGEGGAIFCNNSAMTITACIFQQNIASSRGGAIYCHSDGPIMESCIFDNNTALEGGALFNDFFANPEVHDCSFNNNHSTSNGGAIFNNHRADALLDNCSFTGNSGFCGGGLFNNFSDPVITDCNFSANIVDYFGGGIYNGSTSNPVVSNTVLEMNQALLGGAAANLSSGPAFRNCQFYNNTATAEGGGVYNSFSATPEITNCSFADNVATVLGGGMYSKNSSLAAVVNTIFWDNTAGGLSTTTSASIHNDNATANISYSLIANSGGSAAWNPAIGTDKNNNIDADPLFVDAANGDLRLLECSPAIYAADITTAPADDLDGNPRPFLPGTAADMGAFEFQGIAPEPVSDPPSGQALDFDGVNDRVAIAALNLNSNTVTIETWIYPDANQVDFSGIVISRSAGTVAGLLIRPSGKLGYMWNGTQWWWTGGPDYIPGQWQHIVLVIEPDKATIYANGVPYENIAGHNPENFAGTTFLGVEDFNFTTRFFRGKMDEVRIWNYARSQTEIQDQSCTDQLTGNEVGLIACYTFSKGNADGINTCISTTLTDISANGNNGTLQNFALSGQGSNWTTGVPDTDADGVRDVCDRCPGFDDAPDADADGVPDGCDQCADTPSGTIADVSGCGTGCVTDILLANTIPVGLHQAEQQIISDGQIASPGIVEFKAGLEILLNAGFEVALGAQFSATIEDCPVQSTMEFSILTGGTFDMGCTVEQTACGNDESPVHSVTLSPFRMSKHEVTNLQYTAFLNVNGNQTEGGALWLNVNGFASRISLSAGIYTADAGFEDFPVNHVTWYGARAFAQWVGGRLPTEAEWEYAARGGNASLGTQYSGSDIVDDVAWYSGNSGNVTHAVGTKLPNELGLYDMSGNVSEWVNDLYSVYSSSPVTDPQGPDPGTAGLFPLFRGGSMFDLGANCRVAKRSIFDPGLNDARIGIRVVLSGNL